MSERERLVAALTRARDNGDITTGEMRAILARYDRGEETIGPFPILPASLITPIDAGAMATGLMWARSFDHRTAVDRFIREVGRFAKTALVGVAAWQLKMQNEIALHVVAQYAIAAGGAARNLIFPTELSRLSRVIADDLSYLSHFGDALFSQNLAHRPPTAAAIAQRSALYAGTGVAEYVRTHEITNDPGPGWVVDYIAKDDPHTCAPCLEAAQRGPYRVGAGPMPGAVCFGRARCRCVRVARRDDSAYARLPPA